MSMILPSHPGVPAGFPSESTIRPTSRAAARQAGRRDRRHGELLDAAADRRALERAGWRTFLSYRENHVRAWDGTLLSVTPVWIAEAERADKAASARAGAVQASAATVEEAWALLRQRAAESVQQAERRAARQRLLRQQRPAA
jgi:hypothetical protein